MVTIVKKKWVIIEIYIVILFVLQFKAFAFDNYLCYLTIILLRNAQLFTINVFMRRRLQLYFVQQRAPMKKFRMVVKVDQI